MDFKRGKSDRRTRRLTKTSLESWFKGGSNKTSTSGSRPTSLAVSGMTSDQDLGEEDSIREYEKLINSMSEKEVNAKFEEMLSDMNLNDDKKKPLRSMDMKQKRKMLLMKCKGSMQGPDHKFDKPQEYHAYLDQYSKSEYQSLGKLLNCVESLRISLTNNTLGWVNDFGSEGLNKILKVLEIAIKNNDTKLQWECLRCTEKYMNNTIGLKSFLNNTKGHNIVARCLNHEKPQVMIQALRILAPLCLVPGTDGMNTGLEKTLSAVTKVAEEKKIERFAPIVNGITKSNNAELQVHAEAVAIKALELLQLDCGLLKMIKNEPSYDSNDTELLSESFIPGGFSSAYEFHENVPECTEKEMDVYNKSSQSSYDDGIFKWLEELTVKMKADAVSDEYKSMCFQFINAMLSQTDDFEFRVHLRNEIVRNGLYDYLADLKNETNPLVKTQFDIFEAEKEADADEIHERFDKNRLDMDDMQDCFEVLKNTTLETPAEPYFLSILQHLLFVKDDVHIRPAYFKIIEECVSQVVLHKSGLDPDFTKKHFDLDLQPLLDELKERPIENDTAKVEELKKQLEEALAAKSEAEAKLDLLIGKGGSAAESGKLDPEKVANIGKVLGPPPPPMPGMGGPPAPPPPPMPGMMGGGGPPPPPMPGLGGPPPPPMMPGMGGPPPPPMPGMGPPPPPMMPGMGPPPPRMPGMGPPIPPPGMMAPLGSGMNTLPLGLKPKKKWETSGPLKKANWKTITPQKMTEKAFWLKVQEETLASSNILDELAQRFSSKPAKQSTDVADKGFSTGTLKKVKQLKVLDSKVAQNISILLGGSLKHMEYDDIKKCLLRCDDEILTANIIEQLIQYLPPADQLNKLQQYKDSYKDLTEAEQFCLKISEIKRLLPRLKSLSFKHHYQEMVQDAKPDIVAATAACEEVRKSKKFHKMLELILLLGNYMNSGSRNAQAYGYEMSFLTKLNGTKDVHNKTTLLHFIVDTVEKNFPELLNFHDEMPHIDKASRVSMETIQKTLKQMDSNIRNLQTDVNNNRLPQSDDDKFLEVMEAFAKVAREQCDVMQNMFKKVENLYQELSEYFVFDKQKYSLDEFFTDLKTFKDNFVEARKENEKERELTEKREKARLAKEKADREKKEREARNKALIDMNPTETQESVMDSLLEALQTGSAFSREQKRKRAHRPAGAERRAQLVRSRSRTGLITGRELTSEIMT